MWRRGSETQLRALTFDAEGRQISQNLVPLGATRRHRIKFHSLFPGSQAPCKTATPPIQCNEDAEHWFSKSLAWGLIVSWTVESFAFYAKKHAVSLQHTFQEQACGVGERCGNRANKQCREA